MRVCEERQCVGVEKAKVKVLEVHLAEAHSFQTGYGQNMLKLKLSI